MYVIDLEVFLRENKLKQKDVAEIIGVSANMISLILHGKAKMPQPKIQILLDAGIYKTSMIKWVKKSRTSSDTVTMSREVFELICSQQRTIGFPSLTSCHFAQASLALVMPNLPSDMTLGKPSRFMQVLVVLSI